MQKNALGAQLSPPEAAWYEQRPMKSQSPARSKHSHPPCHALGHIQLQSRASFQGPFETWSRSSKGRALSGGEGTHREGARA